MDPTTNSVTNGEKLLAILKERQSDYGNPKDYCTRLAAILTAAGFEFKGQALNAEHIPLIFLYTKVLRECNKHKDDNLDDINGYVEVLRRCMD